MLSNHAVALCLPNERRDLEHARDSLALTDTDIAEITSLPSQKGSYSTLYMISKRGRGAIRIAPGAPEYWIASSNPELDQPLRHAALQRDRREPVESAHPALRSRLAGAPTSATGSRSDDRHRPVRTPQPDQADLAGSGRRVHDRARPGRAARRRRQPALHLDRAVADRVPGRVGRVDRDRVRAAVGRDQRVAA